MSNKLNASLKKIEKITERSFREGYTSKQGKNSGKWSPGTRDTYCEMAKACMRDIHQLYGIADITKVQPEHVMGVIDRRISGFQAGNTKEASNVKTLIHAMHAVQNAAVKTGVFKKELNLIDKKAALQHCKENDVRRKSSFSTTYGANVKECMQVLDNVKTMKSKLSEAAYHVGKITLLSAGRHAAVLKLTVKDIKIDVNRGTVEFLGDKGNKDNTAYLVGKETATYFKSLTEGKDPKQNLFTITNQRGVKKGEIKSARQIEREMNKIYAKAGAHLTKEVKTYIRVPNGKYRDKNGKEKTRWKKQTVTVTQTFSHHSFRKGFASGRLMEYLGSSKTKIENEIARRIREDKKGIVKAKLDEVEKRRGRKLELDEKAVFLTSLDLFHYREDIVTMFYTTHEEVQSYLKEIRNSRNAA
ncbi:MULTISPECIES: hypothetical protein [Bacillaceae]|uniref:hypothetical protein n=3 Tax=Bacillales TaxID=1385 RepID=UPI000B4B735C|nr:MULTISPECIES: hypothetical protein [Bacillus cereus group]ASK17788.1 hypothetical protein BA201_28135 [Bacillus cereus]MBL3786269.1 hypothetical protein [Bacillus cereus]MBL3802883.1 hypothetical protein [Bacillus cereus]MBL3817990.1 hypothetical protein [Bacillus cereus]MDA1620557.1 hypothetical protein [Bacillus cereus group sp. TH204-1LC]